MSKRQRDRRSERRRQAQRITKRVAAGTGFAVGAAALAPAVGHAATYEVTNTSDDAATPGSLRAAIVAANADPATADEIVFQSSVTGTINVGPEMNVTGPVSIQGPGWDVLTLEGGDDGRILDVVPVNPGAGVSVSDMTLTGGEAIGSNDEVNGGAIRASEADLALEGLVITGNVAEYYGGGVYSNDSTLAITNSTISGNDAADGGGIAVRGHEDVPAAFTLSGVDVLANDATKPYDGGRGGGIYVGSYVDTATITAALVTGNTATGDGGGLFLNGDASTVRDSFVFSNDANYSAGIALSGPGTVEDSTISDNTAAANGGGIGMGMRNTIVRSLVSGNEAVDGAGVYARLTRFDEPDPAIRNTTISGNTASGDGGGILAFTYNYSATTTDNRMRVDSATIANNGADRGGGVFAVGVSQYDCETDPDGNHTCADGPDVPAPTLTNTLVGDNAAATAGADLRRGSQLDPFAAAFSLIETDPGPAITPSATNVIGEEPQIAPLEGNGGETDTHMPEPGSPAIDAGNTSLTEDGRGLARPLDLLAVGNRAGSDGSDIGAVEVVGETVPVDTGGQDDAGGAGQTQGPPAGGPPPPPPPPPPPGVAGGGTTTTVGAQRPRCFGKTATIVGRGGLTTGTRGPDVIVGTRRRDRIFGGGGKDLICSLGGNDTAVGGAGNDRINGGGGRDTLIGGAGRDRLLGGSGIDALRGGAGRDRLSGGAGRDTCATDTRARRC